MRLTAPRLAPRPKGRQPMLLNKNKLAICLGLLSGLAAPFATGSVSLIASFPEAQFQARKQYTVAVSAAASAQSLEQQYTRFLLDCRANIREDCDLRRSDPDKRSFWLFSSCQPDAQAEIGCIRAWSDLPPSDSFLAQANAFVMAAPTLFQPLAILRCFSFSMFWHPFIRWLKT